MSVFFLTNYERFEVMFETLDPGHYRLRTHHQYVPGHIPETQNTIMFDYKTNKNIFSFFCFHF